MSQPGVAASRQKEDEGEEKEEGAPGGRVDEAADGRAAAWGNRFRRRDDTAPASQARGWA